MTEESEETDWGKIDSSSCKEIESVESSSALKSNWETSKKMKMTGIVVKAGN